MPFRHTKDGPGSWRKKRLETIGSVLFLGAVPPLIGTHFTALKWNPATHVRFHQVVFVSDGKAARRTPDGFAILGLCPAFRF
jgi:hypothetical protein